MITEISQLICCGISTKSEILLDRGARRVRAHGPHGHHAPLKPTALRATRFLFACPAAPDRKPGERQTRAAPQVR
jgi:hypothetical protein